MIALIMFFLAFGLIMYPIIFGIVTTKYEGGEKTQTIEHGIQDGNIMAAGLIILIILMPEIRRAKVGSVELELSEEPLRSPLLELD